MYCSIGQFLPSLRFCHLALPFAADFSKLTLNIFQLNFLASMVSWPSISALHVHFDVTLVLLDLGMFPIMSNALDNLLAVPINFDAF